MPFEGYVNGPEARLTVLVRRRVTASELSTLVRELARVEQSTAVIDMTWADGSEVEGHLIQSLARECSYSGRLAVVAPNIERTYGRARMFKLAAKAHCPGSVIYVFRRYLDALQWLRTGTLPDVGQWCPAGNTGWG